MVTMMITKDDDKKLKDQSKNNSSESRTFQEFKIRIKKNSRLKRKFRVKNQDSRFKISRIKSRFKNQEKAYSR